MLPKESKLLVCDDSYLSRRLLKNILERNGYLNIREASSADQAIGILLNEEVQPDLELDLIFMDIVMPGITGVDFVKKLRVSKSKFSKTPIIMVSAEADKETVMGALMAGANDYILKPIDEKGVLTKIRSTWEKFNKVKSSP